MLIKFFCIFITLPVLAIASSTGELSELAFKASICLENCIAQENLTEQIDELRSEKQQLVDQVNLLFEKLLSSKSQYRDLSKDRLVIVTHQKESLESKTANFIQNHFDSLDSDRLYLASEVFPLRSFQSISIPNKILYSEGGEIPLQELHASEYHLFGGFVQICLSRTTFEIIKKTNHDLNLNYYTNLTYASFKDLKDTQVKEGLIFKAMKRMQSADNSEVETTIIVRAKSYLLTSSLRSVQINFVNTRE